MGVTVEEEDDEEDNASCVSFRSEVANDIPNFGLTNVTIVGGGGGGGEFDAEHEDVIVVPE